QVQSITWRLLQPAEKEHPVDLTMASSQTVAESVHLPPQRGVYALEVRLHTREANPQEAIRLVTVRYQPPPPEIRLECAWVKQNFDGRPEVPKTVRAAKFKLRAQLAARSLGQPVQASVLVGQKEISRPVGMEINRDIDLQEGDNTITLKAQNKDALPGYERYETEERSFIVVYQKQPAPQLLIKSIEPAVGRPQRMGVEPGKTL